MPTVAPSLAWEKPGRPLSGLACPSRSSRSPEGHRAHSPLGCPPHLFFLPTTNSWPGRAPGWTAGTAAVAEDLPWARPPGASLSWASPPGQPVWRQEPGLISEQPPIPTPSPQAGTGWLLPRQATFPVRRRGLGNEKPGAGRPVSPVLEPVQGRPGPAPRAPHPPWGKKPPKC